LQIAIVAPRALGGLGLTLQVLIGRNPAVALPILLRFPARLDGELLDLGGAGAIFFVALIAFCVPVLIVRGIVGVFAGVGVIAIFSVVEQFVIVIGRLGLVVVV